MPNYFELYQELTLETECPAFYHRWAAISSLAAVLGRDCYFQHGHFDLAPNIYCMLIGTAGTRKSTAIKLAKKVLLSTGFDNLAAEKTSKEKFLFDLAAQNDHSLLDDSDSRKHRNGTDILEQNLFGDRDYESQPPAESYIAADEFNDFLGSGNMEFISLLGNLWDFSGVFKHRVKTGKSIAIPNPTINLFGGNTPTGFASCFPPETLGQGFLSRLLLVYGEPTGTRITFPRAPSAELAERIRSQLVSVKQKMQGGLSLDEAAATLLDSIYQTFPPIDDSRFASYSNRRFTHLLKLCITCAAAEASTTIRRPHVLLANTILAHTETMMPKALGEFGKGKNSDVAHTVMCLIEGATKGMTNNDIYTHVYNDLNKPNDLQDIVSSLQVAGRIQLIQGKWFPKKKASTQISDEHVDWNLLTEKERTGA